MMPSYMGSPNRRGGAHDAMMSPYQAGGNVDQDLEERRMLARERAMELARQQGERVGKWAAEFDDMKRRLKQVESREETTRSFRAQARERLREQRRLQQLQSSGGSGDENGGEQRLFTSDDPDADMLIYDSAEGFIRQSRSPKKTKPKRTTRRSRSPNRDAPSVPLEGEENDDRSRARDERYRWDAERNSHGGGLSRSSSKRSRRGGERGEDLNLNVNDMDDDDHGGGADDEIDSGRETPGRRSKQSHGRNSRSNSRSGGRDRYDDQTMPKGGERGDGNLRNSRRSLRQSRDSLRGDEDDSDIQDLERDARSSRRAGSSRSGSRNMQQRENGNGNGGVANLKE